MSSHQPLSPRFIIALSIVCLTMSACTGTKPAMDTATNNRGEYEANAEELRKSAEEGDASAQNALGLLYSGGRGVPQDSRQAKQWFEKAAEQRHAGAQVNLGTLYLRGDGAPESEQMALFWFSRAAAQRDALAFAKLGRMYERGRGVSQDLIQA
ncbi:MAG TPA: tetratricopeptide repeat protein, partial [Nitrospirota bacterium]